MQSNKKIVTLGEIMLRLSPPQYLRFYQANSFDAVYGGGEANVSLTLAMFGHKTEFVSKVPKNEIGDNAVNSLRQYGVGTSFVKRGGDRLGIYFIENGASVRPSKVIYDRAGSSISQATESDFDFDEIFSDAKWFHISGITPALSQSCAKITEIALKKAREHSVRTSFDLNFRKKLWTPKEAQAVLRPLMQYVDVCIGNEEDAQNCLGFELKGVDIHRGHLETEEYKLLSSQMKQEFGFKMVASTLRESISANDNNWSACLTDESGNFHLSRKYPLHIVDRVGGGDSFSGGLIHGLLEKPSPKEALEFAVSSSALKHTIFGDANLVTLDEVETLLKGDGSGRVQR